MPTYSWKIGPWANKDEPTQQVTVSPTELEATKVWDSILDSVLGCPLVFLCPKTNQQPSDIGLIEDNRGRDAEESTLPGLKTGASSSATAHQLDKIIHTDMAEYRVLPENRRRFPDSR